MSFEIKQSKTICYTQKHIYLRKIHKEEKVTLKKLNEKDKTMFQHHKETHYMKKP